MSRFSKGKKCNHILLIVHKLYQNEAHRLVKGWKMICNTTGTRKQTEVVILHSIWQISNQNCQKRQRWSLDTSKGQNSTGRGNSYKYLCIECWHPQLNKTKTTGHKRRDRHQYTS